MKAKLIFTAILLVATPLSCNPRTEVATKNNSDICYCYEGIIKNFQEYIDTSATWLMPTGSILMPYTSHKIAYKITFEDAEFDIKTTIYKDSDITNQYCYLYKSSTGNHYILSKHKREGLVNKCCDCAGQSPK